MANCEQTWLVYSWSEIVLHSSLHTPSAALGACAEPRLERLRMRAPCTPRPQFSWLPHQAVSLTPIFLQPIASCPGKMGSREISVKAEMRESGGVLPAPAELPKSTRGAAKVPTKKTIKAPGLAMERSAQACDRCRVKKSKCDGKFPACSACTAAGLKCIVSDKLSRRSFPKGYTETLEERVRALENENTKLQGLLKLRELQLLHDAHASEAFDVRPDAAGHPAPAKASGPDLLNPFPALHSSMHDDSCPCCVTPGSSSVHERPVSLAGSVYNPDDVSVAGSVISDDNDSRSLLSIGHAATADFPSSDGVNPAPGAFAAATAIEQMQKKRNIQGLARPNAPENGPAPAIDDESKLQLLTELVAASIPRSTEETLFVPTLLAKICEVYGYRSTAARLTASAIASLKTTNKPPVLDGNDHSIHARLTALLLDLPEPKLAPNLAVEFLGLLGLPPAPLRHSLLTDYFRNWGDVCPIVNKNAFLRHCVVVWQILESGYASEAPTGSYELVEKLGAILVLMMALSTSSCTQAPADSALQRYHRLVHEFIKPNCILTKHCSVQSLQILALSLQYFLATGDYITCYQLRGRVISMAQQLRMHRCPAAVLGAHLTADRHVQGFLQGERRILFWCIYSLDAFCSLSLGVPRLLKDYEIECAMPFANSFPADEDDAGGANENILIVNNTRLTIFGRVSAAALAYMQYAKVLGSILDSIFSRLRDYDNVLNTALTMERLLDCWRRDLPPQIRFETDTHGFLQPPAGAHAGQECNLTLFSNHQKLCVFLFYHAKILIFLPIISKHGFHLNVGISLKEQLSLQKHDSSSVVASMTLIQQSLAQILRLLKHTYETSYLLPLPLNILQEHARFALLVARGSLDYIKNGPLYQNLKQLLLDTVSIFKSMSNAPGSGSLTNNSAVLLELLVLSILGIKLTKPSNNLRKRAATAHFTRVVPSCDPLHPNSVAPAGWLWDGMQPAQAHAQKLPGAAAGMQRWPPHDAQDSQTTLDGHSTADWLDNISNILDFDPFEMNYAQDLMDSDFVTDGSLGLVPFLKNPSGEPLSVFGRDDEMYPWGS